ncbi:hypothetical protein DN752_05980 [Echinicola strongylocentroti]|uniref:RNA polymerase sigma-70 factor n=1 Tax=Echinicola strongylocentroti TaxID=1795355 RepID=A0A2Z4IGV5_9BACT|nr:RNA polymerase sigma-70 factor [Echinicola strongylocentroti]AWW29708.1 hypothetical protein DN752_05980 [Echinicola strongylocentroti]
MNVQDKILLKELQERNQEVFEALFREYYSGLLRFAEGIVFDEKVSEDIVQNIFLFLWERVEYLVITASLKQYLYQAVKNRCFNHLRNIKIRDKHNVLYLEACLNDRNVDLADTGISRTIEASILNLPPKMAEIFRLKYQHVKSIRAIAEELEVSENTVKTQLYRAKIKLRASLQESLNLHFVF